MGRGAGPHLAGARHDRSRRHCGNRRATPGQAGGIRWNRSGALAESAQDYINAANGFLAERFLFGTAYPLLPFKDGVEAMLRLGLKESVMDRVLYENAAELLGIGQ
ncbi:MAG: amidohydrolase family protein [Betaproteobacteria bacterium]|nr:amidohydrolase family protein [Betaproteobacteria bacterium]